MTGPQEGRDEHGARTEEHAARSAAFGLVPSPTSDRNTDKTIDRFESRIRRLRKNVITSARLIRDAKQQGGHRHFMAMLTLTYAPGIEWKSNHIPDLQKRIRGWLRYRGHEYAFVWVCELQERGAPHYHILIWIPRGLRLPKADQFGWWPHGSTSIEKVEKPIGYLMKYLSKGQDTIHRYVKGQRTHGSGGLNTADKRERRWWLAPSYVRNRWPDHKDDVRPAKGGGWMSRVTGEVMPSPWKFISWHPLTGAVIRWIAGPEIGWFNVGTKWAPELPKEFVALSSCQLAT